VMGYRLLSLVRFSAFGLFLTTLTFALPLQDSAEDQQEEQTGATPQEEVAPISEDAQEETATQEEATPQEPAADLPAPAEETLTQETPEEATPQESVPLQDSAEDQQADQIGATPQDTTAAATAEEPAADLPAPVEEAQDEEAAPARTVIYHQGPDEALAADPLALEAVVESDLEIASVNIFFRNTGQTAYRTVAMSASEGNLYAGVIPASEMVDAGLEYHLIVILADESVVAYPADDPQNNPLQVAILPNPDAEMMAQMGVVAGVSSELELLILSPEPNEILLPEDVVVAVSLFYLSDLDLASIRILVDGDDITAEADVSAEVITYLPPDLGSGEHIVEVHASSLGGVAYQPVMWPFRVTARVTETTVRAYSQSGSVVAGLQHRDQDNQLLDEQTLRLKYRAGWDWLTVQSNVKLSTLEDPFKQARNRYAANIITPIFELGLGDVTPRLQRFTLDGKRVRGFSAHLKLKYFNLQVVQGELERVIQGRPDFAYGVTDYVLGAAADTLQLTRKGYGFRRDLIAIRPSFGSGEKFQLAFSYVKAKDNISSVLPGAAGNVFLDSTLALRHFSGAEWDTSKQAFVVPYDDIASRAARTDFDLVLPQDDWAGRSPQDNLIIGSDLTLALDQRRLVVQSGFAMSMLNKNIWDPVLSLEELDTFAPGDTLEDGLIAGSIDTASIPFNPADFAEYFHMNLNQVPLLPIDPFLVQENPFEAITKMPSLAYHATAKLNYLNNFITAEIQQVGPEYNSLANPNIQKNVRVRTLSDRIRMFKNKLFLTALYRSTDDDIVKLVDDPITSTEMLNFSANLNLGFGLPSFSAGTRSYIRDNGIDELDTVAVSETELTFIDKRSRNVTKATNFGFTYRLNMLGSTHDLNLSLYSTKTTDGITDRHRDDPLYTSPISPVSTAGNLALSITSRLSDDLGTEFNYSQTKAEQGEDSTLTAQDVNSLGLLARYRLMDGKLRVRGGFVLLTSNSDRSGEKSVAPPPNFSRMGIKGGLEYQLIRNLQFVASLELRSKKIAGITGTTSSTIVTSSLRYNF